MATGITETPDGPAPGGATTAVTTTPGAGLNGVPEHKPFVPDLTKMPEFTLPAVLSGTFLGLIFAASSLYLVLKVGMTVSASIPVAVLAITLFRALTKAFGLRRATILENNITQTAGSAGESIAFGVGVTMPALMMLGFNMDLGRVMLVSILGGVLGILAMIPLRRAFIVKMHGRPGQPGTLLYPEGTACAQVLIAGEQGGTTGAAVFLGFGIAFIHKWLTIGVNVIKETISIPVKAISKAAVLSGDMASEMLGVGYIIGLRTSAIMMGGAILGYLVIIPMIFFVGEHAPEAIAPSSSKLIKDMSVSELRNNYLLYIGAGCVAAAGIISMGRTLPMIARSVAGGIATVRGAGGAARTAGAVPRTENDMPMKVVILGSIGLVLLLALFLAADIGPAAAIAGALLVVLFGFLFVTVSSRLTGEIGSSSNPISGMTVATLMLTCLIFLALGWTSPSYRLLAITIAGVVCIASSNGGTTAQDLKTGYLVGGTPRSMQYAILIGAMVSALVIGITLIGFNQAGTIYSDDPQYLPVDKDTGAVVTLSTDELARVKAVFPMPESYQGKEYQVWDTRREIFAVNDESHDRPQVVRATNNDSTRGTAPAGRFLVDPGTGKVAWLKDPTIGGAIKFRAIELSSEERTGLASIEFKDKKYLVWQAAAGALGKKISAGDYLIDPDSGRVTWKKDGDEYKEFQGTELTRFDAPKTQVMRIIIEGVLTRKLNWTLVLIGALIAVTLELCGVSSLAFAVGVYVPIQYSTPIFLGGTIRWLVDKYLARSAAPSPEQANDPEAKARAEIEAIRKSETSPGVLLASGYIAGGSLAGVAAAFLEFVPSFKDTIDFSKQVESLDTPIAALARYPELAEFLTPTNLIAMGLFAALVAFAVLVGMGKVFKIADDKTPDDADAAQHLPVHNL